jgi:hypothetical protein
MALVIQFALPQWYRSLSDSVSMISSRSITMSHLAIRSFTNVDFPAAGGPHTIVSAINDGLSQLGIDAAGLLSSRAVFKRWQSSQIG